MLRINALYKRLGLTVAVALCWLAIGSAQSQAAKPDLSGIDPSLRAWIERACENHKVLGPASYYSCLKSQAGRLTTIGGKPRLTDVPPDERAWIERACENHKVLGPASYYSCLKSQAARLATIGGKPSLTNVPPDERAWIERACENHKVLGPASYYSCLRSQVAQLGYTVEPSGSEQATPARSPHNNPADVRAVQWELSKLGIYRGPVDGLYGPETRRAIETFQRNRKLPIDGKVSSSLLAALREVASQQAHAVRAAPRKSTKQSGATPAISPVTIEWPHWKPVAGLHISAESAQDLGAASVFAAVKASVWTVVAGRSAQDFDAEKNLSQGSSVAISENRLLTNCHVVERRPVIAIVQGNEVAIATLDAADPPTDRCVLAVFDRTLIPVRGLRRFSSLVVGEHVYAIGAPSGLDRTLSEGLISGLRERKRLKLVQTTAPISPGSSGGGLFDGAGNLIGITTFLLRDAQSLNFAISADEYGR